MVAVTELVSGSSGQDVRRITADKNDGASLVQYQAPAQRPTCPFSFSVPIWAGASVDRNGSGNNPPDDDEKSLGVGGAWGVPNPAM